jgi:hypothetical protein
MRYLYLLIANIAVFAFAGHNGLDWLSLIAIIGDFAIWRHWSKQAG